MCQQPKFRFPPWLQQLLWGSSSFRSVTFLVLLYHQKAFQRDFNRQMQTGRKLFHACLEEKFGTGKFFLMATSTSEPSYTCVVPNGANKVCIQRASSQIAQKLSRLSHQRLARGKGTCHRNHTDFWLQHHPLQYLQNLTSQGKNEINSPRPLFFMAEKINLLPQIYKTAVMPICQIPTREG